MAYNSHHKLLNNIATLRIALEHTPGARLNADEEATLQRYAGFGGIKAVLYPNADSGEWLKMGATQEDMRLYPAIMELHALLNEYFPGDDYKAVVKSLQNSVLTAFYTPEIVPATFYRVLQEEGIRPTRLYEPSSGAGVFIAEAIRSFPALKEIIAVEKDILTARILSALLDQVSVPAWVLAMGFEEAPINDNGGYDLIASNIPFGNFSVHDPAYPDSSLSGKIHNYFFAKGLDKIKDGGLLAYITTDGFLNSPSNRQAREYLFSRANFISLAVLPDNLMKETGNTEASSHLLILQKDLSKSSLSAPEQLLLETRQEENEFGTYTVNRYIAQHPEILVGNEIKPGKNQYGGAHQTVWQRGNVDEIASPLALVIREGIKARFRSDLFSQTSRERSVKDSKKKELTFIPPPEDRKSDSAAQLGLFDSVASPAANRATAYLSAEDETQVQKTTARIIATISTAENPGHESIVLITARSRSSNQYQYKLYSNLREIMVPRRWMNGSDLIVQLESLSRELKGYGYTYRYEGDKSLEPAFLLSRQAPSTFGQLKPYHKAGALVVYQEKVGVLSEVDKENNQATFNPISFDQQDLSFFKVYTDLRDDYFASEPGKSETLPKTYEAFARAYGQLNAQVNQRRILKDEAFGLVMLSSLERREGEKYVPSDLVTGSLQTQPEKFFTDDPLQALARSLNEYGSVDIFSIASSLGQTEEEAVRSLGHHIYLSPGNHLWETAEQYLGGNVVEKLRVAEQMVVQNPDDLNLNRSLEAIRRVQPEPIPFELLDFNLGERWMPIEIYSRFATNLFQLDTAVSHLPSLDIFSVSIEGRNAKVSEEYAIQPKRGSKMYGNQTLQHALENTSPFFTYETEAPNGEKIRMPDNEATQLAHQKIEMIRSSFSDWMQELSRDDKDTITKLYNETFNCYTLREYNGDHQSFPGLNKEALGISDLYSSQKNAVWRIIQNRGALVDHEVGLGKTLTMVVAAQEMKRLGIIQKPLILALKANVSQIADTYRKAYPRARLLAPGENDFAPAKRQRLFHEIKNNNWDCIILTHDQFGRIPQSAEIQRKILQTELDNLEKDLHTVKNMDGAISKVMLKGLQIRQNNLSGKLKEILSQIEMKKDEDIHFQALGVDHLFIDEAHKFKNLTFTSRHNRVAGLGNMEGSQKALNMLFAVRTLQEVFEADLCVTFLSGTPISNSLTEMYLLFKYLRPRELEKQHIENFDAWAAVFARKTVDFEFSVTNQIITKERFRHFIKVPELALFYNEITDYKTAKHIGLDKPELAEELVNIPPTPDQQAFTQRLMKFAQTGDGTLIGRSRLSPEEDKGRMLIATNYAKKMSADMRLIDPAYADDPGSKVNVCARKVAELYQESAERKGTQIIFSDIGTPKPNEFNIYDALKEKLIQDFDIPPHEISFIHDWTDLKKPELFRKMNRGDIRILIGSTDKAGTGLNVQRRVIAMHHLDIPWKPAELEQRNGRGARQGNLLAKEHYQNKVRNYIYAVEQTLDNYKFNLLKNKQTFISQMKNSSLHVRTIDEGAIDEKTGMNFSEYIAILSGDTTLLEKSKVEKKIAVLESVKGAHYREISRSKYKLGNMREEVERISRVIEKLSADQLLYKKNLRYEKDGTKANPILLNHCTAVQSEEIGKFIVQLHSQYRPGALSQSEEKIGSLYGFDLFIRSGLVPSFYASNPETGIKYAFNQGQPNMDNPKLAARHFLNAIDRIDHLLNNHQAELKKLESEARMIEQIVSKPFEKDEELKHLKGELSCLEKKMSLKVQEAKMNEHTESAKVISIVENIMEAPQDESQNYSRLRRRGR